MAIEYPHRANKDGTIDSICPLCYVTLGTSHFEADLERMEVKHICNPARLHYLEERKGQMRAAIEPRKPPHSEPAHAIADVGETSAGHQE